MFLAATDSPKRMGVHAVPEQTLICSNLISPHFVGDSAILCMWIFPTASCRDHEFRNVQYTQMEQRSFQSVLIEFLALGGVHLPFEDTATHTKAVLH